MSATTMLRRMFATKSRTYRNPKPRQARLAIQELEARSLMAASLTASLDVADGILRVEGTYAADQIHVRQSGFTVRVDGIPISIIDGATTTTAASVSRTRVTRIEVAALDGNDVVQMHDTLNRGVAVIPMVIHGGSGNDTLTGGQAADTIFGESGVDSILGGAGKDLLYGDSNPAAAKVVQDYGLRVEDEFLNWYGKNEKWFLERDVGQDVYKEFYLTPEGGLYEYSTYVPSTGLYTKTDILLETLDPSYYQDTRKMENERGLYHYDLYYGNFGRDEKWLVGIGDPNSDGWYFITPVGELYRWDGTYQEVGGRPFATGTLLATLDFSYLADPFELVKAGTDDGAADRLNGQDDNDYLNGGAGNDYLDGRVGNDTLFGLAGNDTLFGWIGNDSMLGGDGADYLNGQQDHDWMNGQDGNDTMIGFDGNDTLFGWLGDDSLLGGAGSDYMNGQQDNDWMNGQEGNDTMQGFDGRDTLFGWTGNDILYGGEDDDYLNGQQDHDRIEADGGRDTLVGFDGRDSLYGGFGNDSLYGGAGNDEMDGQDDDDWLQGDGENDRLVGHYGRDSLYGGFGNDSLYGGFGNDTLDGQDDNDTLDGQQDDDTLIGHFGADWLNGSFGNDSLYGGFGYDTLYGGFGNDLLDGQEHDDTLDGQEDDDTLTGRYGFDSLYGGLGSDSLFGGFGNDKLYGGSGNDLLDGQVGDDRLEGQENDDTLYGDNGSDTLDGGAGNDGLFGGMGINVLRGGGDADRFLTWSSATDILLDPQWNDVNLQFNNTTALTLRNSNEVDGAGNAIVAPLRYNAAAWSDAEIRIVDGGLMWAHQLTGNTRLMKPPVVDQVYATQLFLREGSYRPWSASDTIGNVPRQIANIRGPLYGGWNGDTGIVINTRGFSLGVASVQETVVHELAHMRDTASSIWPRWLAVSGWRNTVPPPELAFLYSVSGDGRWWYLSTSNGTFYRAWVNANDQYSSFNPMEDWATTWEAYRQRSLGNLSPAIAAALAAKFDILDQVVGQLSVA